MTDLTCFLCFEVLRKTYKCPQQFHMFFFFICSTLTAFIPSGLVFVTADRGVLPSLIILYEYIQLS